MSAKYKMDVDRGATFRIGFLPKHEDGTAWDLTGVTFRFSIRDDTARSLRANAADITTADGKVWLTLSAADTEALPSHRRMYYVLDLVYPSGDVRRLIEGPMYAKPTGLVTR